MNRAQRLLLTWYERNGRKHLPWRQTRDPYRVLISEFMLQQTQVDRVIPKYADFLSAFPDVQSLASATTADVLRSWKGLGYNSRAVRLRQIAQAVRDRFGGCIPSDDRLLRSLPGVGEYTTAAVRAFAFGLDDAAIDTNVRRVVNRLRYGVEHPPAERSAVDAGAKALVPPGRGHDWNSAMMDLGATICTARAPKCLLCPIGSVCSAYPIDVPSLERARGKSARRRSPQEALPFSKTTRFARGRIIDRLRRLPPGARISLLDLHVDLYESIDRSPGEVGELVKKLEHDGLVELRDETVCLRSE